MHLAWEREPLARGGEEGESRELVGKRGHRAYRRCRCFCCCTSSMCWMRRWWMESTRKAVKANNTGGRAEEGTRVVASIVVETAVCFFFFVGVAVFAAASAASWSFRKESQEQSLHVHGDMDGIWRTWRWYGARKRGARRSCCAAGAWEEVES
ncbi:unnamed protein product [Ectocarpus fasciculatus]